MPFDALEKTNFDNFTANDQADYDSLETGRDLENRDLIKAHFAHRIRLGGYITYKIDGEQFIEDKDGVRPFPFGSTPPKWPDSAELEIRELAWMNRIHAETTGLDVWAKSVSALAGDEINFDEVQMLVTAMRKAKVHDPIELTKLHARYLAERNS